MWTPCLIPSETEIIHMLTSREWGRIWLTSYTNALRQPGQGGRNLPRTQACPPLPSRAVLSPSHLLSWSRFPTGLRSLSHSPSSLPLLPSNPRCHRLGAQGTMCSAPLARRVKSESQHQQRERGQPLRMCRRSLGNRGHLQQMAGGEAPSLARAHQPSRKAPATH